MPEELLPKPETSTPLPEASTQTVKNEKPAGKSPVLKFLLLGVIVAIILAAIGGAYVLGQNKSNQPSITTKVNPTPTPAPNPTADWKVTDSENNTEWKKYTNTKLNYSFEIPKTWKHEMDYDNEAIILQSPDLKINEHTGRAIEGSTIKLNSRVINETSIDKWFNDYWSQPHGGGRPENKTNTYIDTNIKALRYENNYESKQIETEFIKDGYLYSINIDFPYREAIKTWSERDLPIYNQILSTFKFTDSTSSTDTSSWKTYTSKCNLSVKYPPTWTAEKYFIVDSDDSCSYITSDEYESGLDTRDGFYIEIKKKNMSQDEYFKEVENGTGSYIPLANKKNRTLGGHQGTSFEPAGYDPGTEFTFTRNNSLYVINWPTEMEADNLTYIENILSSIKFN